MIKKTILVLVVTLFTLTITAQEDVFAKDAQELVEMVSKSALEPVIDQFTAMVAEDKKEAFVKELKGTFPSLYKEMAKIYMAEFTHNEIKEILAFYATPIGKKLANKTGVLSQKGMAAGQVWGMELTEIMKKYQ